LGTPVSEPSVRTGSMAVRVKAPSTCHGHRPQGTADPPANVQQRGQGRETIHILDDVAVGCLASMFRLT